MLVWGDFLKVYSKHEKLNRETDFEQNKMQEKKDEEGTDALFPQSKPRALSLTHRTDGNEPQLIHLVHPNFDIHVFLFFIYLFF